MNTENKEKSQLLREALESANGICRSAYQIAHRISTDHGDVVLETNFGAFKWRCKESLAIQHRVMFPEQYGEDRLVRAKDGPLSLEETVRILGADGHYRLPVRPVSVAHARSMIDKMQSDDAAAIEALIGGNTITQLACEVLRLSRSISNIPIWIPVGERLPANAEHVLVWTSIYANAYKAIRGGDHFDIEGVRWEDQDDDPLPRVTHWMPLPEAPK